MRIFYHERAPFASVFLCENEDFTCTQYDALGLGDCRGKSHPAKLTEKFFYGGVNMLYGYERNFVGVFFYRVHIFLRQINLFRA